jgi:hypothetical protein
MGGKPLQTSRGGVIVYEPRLHTGEMRMPIGCNFVCRRSLFDAVGLFNIHLGPQPGAQIAGEETDMLRRFQARGETIFYAPFIRVFHPVDPARPDPSKAPLSAAIHVSPAGGIRGLGPVGGMSRSLLHGVRSPARHVVCGGRHGRVAAEKAADTAGLTRAATLARYGSRLKPAVLRLGGAGFREGSGPNNLARGPGYDYSGVRARRGSRASPRRNRERHRSRRRHVSG